MRATASPRLFGYQPPSSIATQAVGTSDEAWHVSIAIWVPIVWYALEASQSVTRWMAIIGGSQQTATADFTDGSPVDRLVYTILMGLGLVILASRKVKWGQLIQRNWAIVALFLYMLLSVAWSDFPAVSVKRWIRALVDVVMVLVVLTDRSPLLAEGTVIRRVMLVNLPLSIILIKYFRTIGTTWDEFGNEMWVGTTTQKNVLGEVAMVAALYCVFELIRRWRQWQPKVLALYGTYLLMALWILRGSDQRSNTSIAGFCLGLALLCGLFLMRSKVAYLRRYLVVAAVVGVFVVSVVQLYQVSADHSVVGTAITASGRDVTLTGRTDLWVDLLAIAREHPLFGTGYGSFWIGNTHNLWARHLWRPNQGHNGYIDVYLELGIAGLLFLAVVILQAYSNVLTTMTTHFERGALHFVWLTVILIHNISESSYLRGTADLWFVFLLAAIVGIDRNVPADDVRSPQGREMTPVPAVQVTPAVGAVARWGRIAHGEAVARTRRSPATWTGLTARRIESEKS